MTTTRLTHELDLMRGMTASQLTRALSKVPPGAKLIGIETITGGVVFTFEDLVEVDEPVKPVKPVYRAPWKDDKAWDLGPDITEGGTR